MTRTTNRLSIGLALCAFLVLANAAFAGPPFQTDDPEPIDYRNYESYIFATSDGTAVETDTVGPGFEFNYGPLPNVHAHIIVPIASALPSNNPRLAPAGIGPNAYGIGDIETGVKFRFIQESKRRPMVGIYPMFELPTGDSRRGLGVGKLWYRMPLWLQKSFGPWTTYGGAGETIVPQVGYRNFTYGGWLVQRDIGKKLTLGTEIFAHGAEGLAAPQTKAAALIDVGGNYYFRNPGFQFLFAYGHSAAGQTENYAYVALYWTWGRKAKDSDSASAQNSPGFGRLAQAGTPTGAFR